MENLIKKIKKIFSKENGNIMIEAVVGMTLITVGMLGVFTLVTNSIRVNRMAGNRFVAANLAAEGIEIIKNIIDTNIAQGRPWNEFLDDKIYELDYTSFAPSGLVEFDSSNLQLDDKNYQYNNGSETMFTREIEIESNSFDDSIIKVNCIVHWEEYGEDRKINIEDHFYNWRE